MKLNVLPSILAADHGKFLDEIQTIDIPEVNYLHVDVMDGHFVPNITFGPQVVASLKKHTRFKLDVHLMIENVDQYIPMFSDAGADIITIHQEATVHLQRSLQFIKEGGARAGVAINPATSPEAIRWILDDVDLVLVMSVNPGYGGQRFIETSVEKLALLNKWRNEHDYRYLLEVDGGIDPRTAGSVFRAGANFLVAGSAVFKAQDRPSAIRQIIHAAKNQQVRQQKS